MTSNILIVGAGVSGLAAAHRLTELGLQPTVVDAADRVGGVIHTLRRDDCVMETGPENFVTNKPWALSMCKQLGIEDHIMPTNDAFRRAMIVHRGRLVPIPEGFLLLAPTKLWPMAFSRLFSPWGKLRMGLEMFIPRRKDQSDESLASFVRRRLGREALDRMAQPLIGGIYTANPEMLSLKATMPMFLEMERRSGSVIRAMRKRASGSRGSGARYSLFVTMADGLDDLPNTLADRIGRDRFLLGRRVETIEPGWSVRLDDGRTLSADALILAGPASAHAGLIEPIDAELGRMLGGIQYASSAVVHLLYDRKQIGHKLDAFGFVVPHKEGRHILAGSFSSVKFDGRCPDGKVLMRAFVGGAMQPRMLDLSDEDMIASAESDMADLLSIRGEPQLRMVHRWPVSMPQYAVGHLDQVEAIRRRVDDWAGLELAGNGLGGVGIPDCIHSGQQAAERLAAKLGLECPAPA